MPLQNIRLISYVRITVTMKSNFNLHSFLVNWTYWLEDLLSIYLQNIFHKNIYTTSFNFKWKYARTRIKLIDDYAASEHSPDFVRLYHSYNEIRLEFAQFSGKFNLLIGRSTISIYLQNIFHKNIYNTSFNFKWKYARARIKFIDDYHNLFECFNDTDWTR